MDLKRASQVFRISDDPSELQFDVIYAFISQSYWAKGIPQETMAAAIKNSLCFGVYRKANGAIQQQVGFARVITDKATFAYLADVFILPTDRGLGLSKSLIQFIVDHKDLQGLRRMMLATRDAHELYQQFGFQAIEQPRSLMEIWQPNIYQK